MKQRVITAVIAILILIPFLIFSDTAAFVFLACLLSVLSAYELLGCVGYRRKLYVTVPTYIPVSYTHLPITTKCTFFL